MAQKRGFDEIDLNTAICETPPSKKLKSEESVTPCRKSYILDFKLKIVETAKKSSNRQTAIKYSLDESQVRNWRKNERKIRVTLGHQIDPVIIILTIMNCI